MEGPAQPRSKARRVERLITNPRWEVTVPQEGLISQLIRPHRRIFVCLDWTDQGFFQRLELSVPTGSRTIPIFWRVVSKGDISSREGSQNLIEEKFIADFCRLLPREAQVVLLADRGFGRTEFFRFLDRTPLSYIIRVKGDTWIRNNQGTFTLKEQKMEPGTVWDLGLVTYKDGSKKGPSIQVRVVTAFGWGSEDAWYLVTDLRDDALVVAGGYGRRFECEETFRSQKDPRFGFGLRHVRLKEAIRYDRLLVVVALASLVAYGVGVKAEAKGLHRILQLNTSKRRQHNLISLGCYWYRKIRGSLTGLLEGVVKTVLVVGRVLFQATEVVAALCYRTRPPCRKPKAASPPKARPPRKVERRQSPTFKYLERAEARGNRLKFKGCWAPERIGGQAAAAAS
jgi:hypothetical protein